MSTTSSNNSEKSQAKPTSGRTQRRAQEQRQAKQRKLIFLGGAVALALIIVAGLILLNRDNGSSSDLPPITASTQVDASIPQDGRTLGNPDATLTIVEYSDFQCPYCGAFSNSIMPNLINDYISTGKVKIEAVDMSFLDDRVSDYGESDMAAEAAACAADQGMYWQYRETLFANQHGENEGGFSKSRLEEAAKVVGLDTKSFNTCFKNKTHQDDVQAMATQASKAGVSQTPTLYLNGSPMNYTGNYDDLKAEIDAALAQ